MSVVIIRWEMKRNGVSNNTRYHVKGLWCKSKGSRKSMAPLEKKSDARI